MTYREIDMWTSLLEGQETCCGAFYHSVKKIKTHDDAVLYSHDEITTYNIPAEQLLNAFVTRNCNWLMTFS